MTAAFNMALNSTDVVRHHLKVILKVMTMVLAPVLEDGESNCSRIDIFHVANELLLSKACVTREDKYTSRSHF